MNKKSAILSAVCLLLSATLIWGCRMKNQNRQENEAYINETENTMDDAVNTAKVGISYKEEENNSKNTIKYSPSMEELKTAVVTIMGENYWPDEKLSEEEFRKMTGFSEDIYEEYMAEVTHNKSTLDSLIVIKFKEGQKEAAEKLLNEYRENMLSEYEGQLQNESKVYASRIEVINNYICYVQLGADTSGLTGKGKDAIVKVCQQENERAIDALEKKTWETSK